MPCVGGAAPEAVRSFSHAEFDPAELVDRKQGLTISVCLPARNEATTVGAIVDTIRRELVQRHRLVDEVLVVDDHSTDLSAEVAAKAGARVVQASEVLTEYGEGHGKGEALWKSLYEAEGDLVVWCDSDVENFPSRFVVGLVGTLLQNPDIAFVKGFYERLCNGAVGGGRVTELVARPLISLLFPHLGSLVQPLAGEYAGRRELLERLPFVRGYGVEIGLLIDVAAAVGVGAMAQVDLGSRTHRNRPLDQLSPQALEVMATALRRAGHALPEDHSKLLRPPALPLHLDIGECPPLIEVASYRRASA